MHQLGNQYTTKGSVDCFARKFNCFPMCTKKQILYEEHYNLKLNFLVGRNLFMNTLCVDTGYALLFFGQKQYGCVFAVWSYTNPKIKRISWKIIKQIISYYSYRNKCASGGHISGSNPCRWRACCYFPDEKSPKVIFNNQDILMRKKFLMKKVTRS